LAQLVLENAETSEVNAVMDFMSAVGLPLTLADLGVESITFEEALKIAKIASIPEESIHSMPFPIVEEEVANSIIVADRIGQAYKDLHQ
jgi:glycerol dehydrogenase